MRCGAGDRDRAGALRGVHPGGVHSGHHRAVYKQFAITIAISVVISGVVALTLSPALAALLLKPPGRVRNGASSNGSIAGSTG